MSGLLKTRFLVLRKPECDEGSMSKSMIEIMKKKYLKVKFNVITFVISINN